MKDNEINMNPGTYIAKIDISYVGNENKTVCIPMSFHDGAMFILYSEKNGEWKEQACSILNTGTIGESLIFDELKKIRPELCAIEESATCELVPMTLDYGQSYCSIYRPTFTENYVDGHYVPYLDGKPSKLFYRDLPTDNNQDYSNQLRQLEIAIDELDAIFKVINPCRANKKVYGNAIRNVIIMCCTEIDMMMKHILERNNCPKKNDYYKTTDYIKLLNVLKLNHYQLCFQRISSATYSPFWRWNNNAPTKSIWWYDAYNAVKHDREVNFKMANLGNAINALVAFAILLIAQYGYRNDLWNKNVGKVIKVVQEPQWELKEFYFYCPGKCDAISYTF